MAAARRTATIISESLKSALKRPTTCVTDAVWPLAEGREMRLEPHGKPLLHDSAPWAELPERGDGSLGGTWALSAAGRPEPAS